MSNSDFSRRRFLALLGSGTAALALPRLGFAEESRMQPNFIIIMADDLGYGDLGCYGNTNIKTPSLDAMAAGGVRFTDFHSNGAVCSPTRAALVTGRYQQRCGVEGVITAAGHRDKGMPLSEVTFAEVLKAAGYSTALFGKWHLGYDPKLNPSKQGFDEFRGFVSGNMDYHSHVDQAGKADWWNNDKLEPETGYATDLVTEHALRYIEKNKARPFCLYLPHGAPHYPLQGPKDAAERTAGKPGPVGGGRKDKAVAYKEVIESMDDGIGRIVSKLRELGIERNTLVFFCSDNGPAGPGSAGPLRAGKGSLFEGGHRVPAIAYWPGKINPAVTGETAMTMDLFPTMAALAGAKLPEGLKLDGIDLGPLLLGGQKLPERSLFWRFGRQTAARKGPWKLYKTDEETCLFNLGNDLSEKNDLAKERPETVRAMTEELKKWEKETTERVERQS